MYSKPSNICFINTCNAHIFSNSWLKTFTFRVLLYCTADKNRSYIGFGHVPRPRPQRFPVSALARSKLNQMLSNLVWALSMINLDMGLILSYIGPLAPIWGPKTPILGIILTCKHSNIPITESNVFKFGMGVTYDKPWSGIDFGLYLGHIWWLQDPNLGVTTA